MAFFHAEKLRVCVRGGLQLPQTDTREKSGFKELVQSPPLTFLVGKDRTRFTIHSMLLQSLSPPLHAMMNNIQMKEASQTLAILEDDDSESFAVFCQYAYLGKFDQPDFDIRHIQHTKPTDLGGAQSDDWRTPEFVCLEPDTPTGSEFISKTQATMDGETVRVATLQDTMFYAKLYVFATKYLIHGLRQAAIDGLHRDLQEIWCRGGSRVEYLDLLEYTYAHTSAVEPGGTSPLRELVAGFIGCSTEIRDHARFQEILISGAEVARDIVNFFSMGIARYGLFYFS